MCRASNFQCPVPSFPYFLPSVRFSGVRIPNCQKIKEGREKGGGGPRGG